MVNNNDQTREDEKLLPLSEQVSSIKKEELDNLNIMDDHSPKYNVSIEEANAKMLERLSAKKTSEYTVDTDDGRKIHKRTDEDYTTIWNAFVIGESADFKEMMGYGKEDIERIGKNDFIDMMDWRGEPDVSKYKTDALQVVKCPSCDSAFGVYQDNLGLCKECAPLFKMDNFWGSYNIMSVEEPEEAAFMLLAFFSQEDFRDLYRRKTLVERIELCKDEGFADVETYKYLTDLLYRVLQEKGIEREGYDLFVSRFDLNITDEVKGTKHEDKVLEIRKILIEDFSEGWATKIVDHLKSIFRIE